MHGIRRWMVYLLTLSVLLCIVYTGWVTAPAWPYSVLHLLRQDPLVQLFLLSVSLLIIALWGIPKWQVSGLEDLKDRLELENEARKTLAQIFGGALLLGVLLSIGRSVQVFQEVLKSNQETLQATQEAIRLSREAQTTERFTQAINQLGATDTQGAKNLEVRLGGIYALERIAQESPRDYWPIMEVLTAYVRAHPGSYPSVDLEAIFTVLRRRQSSYGKGERYPLNLQGMRFPGAALQGINLRGANLAGANLARSNLTGADLSDTNLTGANLQEASLQGASFRRARLLHASLEGVALRGVDLEGAILVDANLRQTDLAGVNLVGAQLAGANFTNANLSGANFTGADLVGATLTGANLQAANLTRANLNQASLQEANLTKAVLQETNLRGVTLIDVKGLTQEQFNLACSDAKRPKWPFNLWWPSGLTPSPSLAKRCKRWQEQP